MREQFRAVFASSPSMFRLSLRWDGKEVMVLTSANVGRGKFAAVCDVQRATLE